MEKWIVSHPLRKIEQRRYSIHQQITVTKALRNRKRLTRFRPCDLLRNQTSAAAQVAIFSKVRIFLSVFRSYLVNSSLLELIRSNGVSIRQSLTVIGLGKVESDVVKSFALRQVVVIRICQKGRAHSSHERFRKAVENVEGSHATGIALGGWSRHGSSLVLSKQQG